jgi:predicted ATP-grasp superfamily ATP-dependent carboligase
MSSVLITEVQSRGGLAVIRSLGARGIRVTASDSDRVALGFFSRYCSRRFVYPEPTAHPDAFADRVLEELSARSYDVVLPMYDDTLLPLSRRKADVEALTRFPFLDFERLSAAQDKAAVADLARAFGLRVPRTYRVDDAAAVDRALNECGLPLIVRPRRARGSAGLHRVDDGRLLARTCATVTREYGPSIIQEYIPWGSATYDVDVLLNRDSQPRAAVVCKRIRTYPPLAGPTACGQAVAWPELRDMAVGLLQAAKWSGPAEVEFRIDPRDGQPTLMEINPRLWGSLYTAMVAGVDFPYLFYRMAMDGDVQAVVDYRTDLRARYFLTLDFLCMATHPRRRSIARSWLGDFFNPRTRPYLLSWRDPLPLIGRIVGTLVYGLRPSRLRTRLERVRVVRSKRPE